MKFLILMITAAIVGLLKATVNFFAVTDYYLVVDIVALSILILVIAFDMVLFEKCDLRDAKKKAAKEGISVIDYAKKGLKANFIEKLDETMNTKTPKEINKFLKTHVKNGTITKQQYIVFLKEYNSQK